MARIDTNLTQIAAWIAEGRKTPQIVLVACKPAPAGLGLSMRGCIWLIDRAKAEFSRAAVFDRLAQRGLAIAQLRDLYNRATKGDAGMLADPKAALSVRRELNKLLALSGSDATAERESATGTATSEAEIELQRVMGHLQPLKLLQQPDAPASELARMAVQRIIELSNRAEPLRSRR